MNFKSLRLTLTAGLIAILMLSFVYTAPEKCATVSSTLIPYDSNYPHTIQEVQANVVIQRVGYDNGDEMLTEAQALAAFVNLASFFEPLGIHFILIETIEIYNTNFVYIYKYPQEPTLDRLDDEYHVQNAINIYFVPDADFDGQALDAPSNACVIINRWAESGVVPHEVGHVLGLHHTFRGSPGPNDGGCEEYVNGTNSDSCGDEIGDTPADYRNSHNAYNQYTCEYTGNQEDSNSDLYDPDPTNLMSYFDSYCIDHFTLVQRDRMFWTIQNYTNSAIFYGIFAYPLILSNIYNGIVLEGGMLQWKNMSDTILFTSGERKFIPQYITFEVKTLTQTIDSVQHNNWNDNPLDNSLDRRVWNSYPEQYNPSEDAIYIETEPVTLQAQCDGIVIDIP